MNKKKKEYTKEEQNKEEILLKQNSLKEVKKKEENNLHGQIVRQLPCTKTATNSKTQEDNKVSESTQNTQVHRLKSPKNSNDNTLKEILKNLEGNLSVENNIYLNNTSSMPSINSSSLQTGVLGKKFKEDGEIESNQNNLMVNNYLSSKPSTKNQARQPLESKNSRQSKHSKLLEDNINSSKSDQQLINITVSSISTYKSSESINSKYVNFSIGGYCSKYIINNKTIQKGIEYKGKLNAIIYRCTYKEKVI